MIAGSLVLARVRDEDGERRADVVPDSLVVRGGNFLVKTSTRANSPSFIVPRPRRQ